ncbi:MAG: dihydropteroate synthase [Flavobacteriales bacterium]|nr:dihydropteroate synthase [Flavobacteriales bacterium]
MRFIYLRAFLAPKDMETIRSPHFISHHGNLKEINTPLVMGIVNMTADSFYAASRTLREEVISKVGEMIDQGADIIDVGGQSTRPGATQIPAKEEKEKVIPVIDDIKQHFPDIMVSVDTFYGEVTRSAREVGADIINDVSAGKMDPEMWPAVAESQLPYVLMHMRGTPATMVKEQDREDPVKEMLRFFSEESQNLRKLGVKDIILDPGFGFGKSREESYQTLGSLDLFSIFEMTMLVCFSRKSMIAKLFNIKPEESLPSTSALNMYAMDHGAQILRVHDVFEAKQCVEMFKMIKGS